MAFKLNGVDYIHADASAAVIPLEGDNAGVPFELLAVKSMEGDLAVTSEHLDGFSLEPLAVVTTGAKPKWKMELSRWAEAADLGQHIGPGAVTIPCNILITFQRPGKPTSKILIKNGPITEGLGAFKSASGSGPAGSLGGNCVNIVTNELDLLNRNAGAASVE